MKMLHPILLAYLARKAAWPTFVGAASLALYELFPATPLSGGEPIAVLIIIIHAIWFSWSLAQMSKGEMAFLYTRGFRWDLIWWHRVVVSYMPALVAIGLAWGMLWLGCRTVVQVGMGNTLYPLLARREIWTPLKWLELYAICIPVGLYAFARANHPGPLGGLWLAIAIGVTTLFVWNMSPWVAGWVQPTISVAVVCVVVMLLWAGQRLHREVEVAS
jgi:hypothetical protein